VTLSGIIADVDITVGGGAGAPDPGLVAALRAAGCVFAEDEAALLQAQARDEAELASMLAARTSGVPLEHVLGWAEFCGLRVAVKPGVFVPRRRTEFLVAHAVPLVRPGSVLVDLCCGSGAIGLAVATAVPAVELYACDVDPVAVGCACENLVGVGTVFLGNLFTALPADLRGRVDLVVASAPYVPTDEIGLMPADARLYEPAIALDGGSDGLDVYRAIAADVAGWLGIGGHVAVETSRDQAAGAAAILSAAGLRTEVATNERAAVVTGGRRSPGWGRPGHCGPAH
jgi:release factor glutamine methyltransferase